MRYMGSKRLLFKHLAPIILKDRKPGQWYVEPFLGGGNSFIQVGGNRLGSDICEYAVALLKAVRDGWVPGHVSEAEYKMLRERPWEYSPELVGFARYSCSFGAIPFVGYARSTGRNLIDEQIRQCEKFKPKLAGATIVNCSYDMLEIPEKSIIYCDPPYKGTTGYKLKFDHEKFYSWCLDKAAEGHKVFISEYDMPEDRFNLECSKTVAFIMNNTKGKTGRQRVECLFTPKINKT